MTAPSAEFFRAEFDDLSRELGGLRSMIRELTVRLRNVETRGKCVSCICGCISVCNMCVAARLIALFVLIILFLVFSGAND